MNRSTTQPNRFRKYLIRGVLATVLIWVGGDFLYSQVIEYRLQQWERTIERDFRGVQKNFTAYSEGEGETAILMVHGFNDSPSAYHKISPQLAARGFHCRVTRLPGFAKPVHEYGLSTAEQWTAHVAEEISQLRQSYDRVWVMAHSLGGATTINVVLEQQPEIDGLILLAPAIDVSSRRSPLLPTRTWHEVGQKLLLFTTVTENPFSVDVKDHAEARRTDRCKFSCLSTVDQMFTLIDANRDRAAEIQLPTLMVLSGDDRVVDSEACQTWFESMGSQHKQLVVNARAGHALPYDFGWETIVDETVNFIERQAESGTTEKQPENQPVQQQLTDRKLTY